jgi:hypothetical protein
MDAASPCHEAFLQVGTFLLLSAVLCERHPQEAHLTHIGQPNQQEPTTTTTTTNNQQ